MSVTEVRKSQDPDPCSGSESQAWVLMAERQAFTGAHHSSLDKPIGSRVGRYTIRECLGVGGMGEVYRADDSVLKRSVALKRITPRAGNDPTYRERLLREAERASSISNQHMAAVYDVFEEESELYLAWNMSKAKLSAGARSSDSTQLSFFLLRDNAPKALLRLMPEEFCTAI